MLAFVGAEWDLFNSAFEIGGVWVGRPKKMAKVVSRPGPLDRQTVRKIADRLSVTRARLKFSGDPS